MFITSLDFCVEIKQIFFSKS